MALSVSPSCSGPRMRRGGREKAGLVVGPHARRALRTQTASAGGAGEAGVGRGERGAFKGGREEVCVGEF